MRAEAGLAVAEQLGRSLHAKLILARVMPTVPLPFVSSCAPLPAESYQQLLDDERDMARAYVEHQTKRLEQQVQSVKMVITEGDPAAALLDTCASEHVRLVVMTTHGRTGLARFALGSVADRVVRYGHVPVLLLRSSPARGSTAKTVHSDVTRLERVLVPLDGSVLAEAALPLARDLGGVVVHHITLVRVLPYTADERTHAEAASYLDARARELRSQLLGDDCTVSTLLREGVVPGEKISEQAEDDGSLVLMATHGRGGIRRWMLGSVANQVVHMGHVPVLLIHPDSAPDAPVKRGHSVDSEMPVTVP
jgi:nucleotide-binding universal stress UspA family protein